MGFPFELICRGRHRVVHGLNCCRCAVAQLPPTEVVSPTSVLFGASSFFGHGNLHVAQLPLASGYVRGRVVRLVFLLLA